MKKKLLSIFLSVAIIFASFPLATVSASAAVENNEQQIEYVGGWNPPEYETDGTLYKDRIAVSKTISPTEDENFFDINLKVVAKPRVIDQSVDVVVVMDISNTMNNTHDDIGPSNSNYNPDDSRLADAKRAVNTFVDQFANNQKISQDRRFSLVTFNSYANVTIPMTTLNTTDSATSVKKAVNAITAPTENRVRFTNIEGGLQLAQNILTKESDAKYKYIIFLTDGFPTTYIEGDRTSTTSLSGYDTYMTGSYNANKINQDGYFADSIRKKLCLYGVNYSDKAADRADDVAANIKQAGINIFSIGLDVGVQSIDNYLSYVANSNFTTIDRRGTTYVIGNTEESYRAWLENSIAGGTQLDKIDGHSYANGNSSEELTAAFENILKDIELLPAETMEEAYTIDPMSDYVEFMNFYNAAGESGATLINSKTGAEVAVFDNETETIKWWLKNTEGSVKDEHGNFILSISYRVRLENEAEDFEPSTAFVTNKITTFYFKTIDHDTGVPLYGDNSIDYKIPEVEGYLGNFEFTKRDSDTGEALEGAEFTLEHHGKSCYVCDGAADIPNVVAVSDANGKVSFTNIPSGHEYVLKETKTPEGYQPGANHSVTVSYGKTYFNDVEVTQSAPVIVENDKIKHIEAVLTAQKTMENRELKADEFTFVLEGINEHGAVFHEKETNDANGNVTFEKMIFDKVGTYKFKVYEEKGTDKTVIYDDTVYEVEFIVTLNDTKDEYILTTKINGEDVDNDATPAPLAFTNNKRGEAEVVLTAEKTMDNAEPEDDAFEFELYDANGKLLQTKTNTGSNVTFDALRYAAEGVYTYTIKELHGNNESIYYDHDIYTATVTVTAPENSESFKADVKYSLGNAPVDKVLFENKTRGKATLNLTADKLMDGKLPADGAFTFELADAEGNVLQTVKNDASGAIKFDTLDFAKTGFYTYSICEISEKSDSVIYDQNIFEVYVIVESHHNNENYIVYVTVAEKVDGKYNVLGSGYGPNVEISTMTFKNESRKPTTVDITAEKTMNGETPAENETFTFELKNEKGEVLQTVRNNGKAVKFDTLTFASTGVYNYTITEAKGKDENVIYDTATYNVTITVTAPEDTDAYQAVTTITKDGEAYTGAPLFENKTRRAATLEIKAEKFMDGNALANEDKYTFALTDADGNVLQETTNNGSEITFDKLTYTATGAYTYYVKEIKGNDTAIIYDGTVHKIEVYVTANENSDTYNVKAILNDTELSGNSVTVNGLKFNNKTRKNAQVTLAAEKTMNGNAPAENEIFTFELKDAQGNIVQTTTNDGRKVNFGTLAFTREGVYTYTITETKGTDNNVIYDTATYNVTITVTAPEDTDAYQAVATITKNGEAYTGTPLFENETTVPTTVPTVPTTVPTVPTTVPTVPTTEPTVPTTEPTVPTTEPTVPTTEPTVPTTEPTVPTTEPTVPTTEPTVPTTEPTVPTTEPTVPTTPNTNTPKTGHNTDFMLWIALLFVSGAVLYEVTVFNKKKNDK